MDRRETRQKTQPCDRCRTCWSLLADIGRRKQRQRRPFSIAGTHQGCCNLLLLGSLSRMVPCTRYLRGEEATALKLIDNVTEKKESLGTLPQTSRLTSPPQNSSLRYPPHKRALHISISPLQNNIVNSAGEVENVGANA